MGGSNLPATVCAALPFPDACSRKGAIMSWTTLPLYSNKKTGSVMVSAQLRRTANGQLSVHVFISAFIMDAMSNPQSVEVQAGSGPMKGMLRITTGSGAMHPMKKGPRGGGKLILPGFDGLPDGTSDSYPCSIQSQTSDELIVRLPVADWEVNISKRKNASAPPPSPPAAMKPEAPVGNSPIDMVAYLRPKGVKISKLAGGRYSLDGETVSAEEVLVKCNSYRKRADLPELTMAQVQ